MGAMSRWVQGLKDRRSRRRAERSGDAGDRAMQRQAAKAQRLQHERLDNKLPR
jgi:hypothetical protein